MKKGLIGPAAVMVAAIVMVSLVSCGPRAEKPASVAAGGAVFEISPEILASRTDTLINIGTINEGEVVQYEARLRNAGSEPLVIKDITTSCGCTSAEYEKQPIAPGAEGYFSFRFDSSGFQGVQLKLIEIKTSAAPRSYKVMVQAQVDPRTDGSGASVR